MDLSIDEFEKMLDRHADMVIPALAKEAQRIVATEIFRGLVETTPVLTGKARLNWFPSIGSPSTGIVNNVAGVRSTGEPMTSGEKMKIASALKDLEDMPLGQTVYIANNLAYVPPLDEGRSQKAPAGIVDVAVHGALEKMVIFAAVRFTE